MTLEKLPPYGRLIPSSCGGLQPSAAAVKPFGPSFAFYGKKKNCVAKNFWFRHVMLPQVMEHARSEYVHQQADLENVQKFTQTGFFKEKCYPKNA